MSDTPRTDERFVSSRSKMIHFVDFVVNADFAKELERELTAASTFRLITKDTPTGYGNDILLWVKGSRPWIGYLGGSDMSDAQCRRDSPTHWAPLPKTPEG